MCRLDAVYAISMGNGNPSVSYRLNKTTIEGNEITHMEEAIRGGHTSASGPFSAKASSEINAWASAHEILLTTSCTAALEMSGLLLDFEPGDRVIVPSFTFVTSALAFARAGATVVFADIEPDTLALDPASVEAVMDERVRAVILVHYGGVAGRLDELLDVLPGSVDLIEDNAHGLFASHRGRPLGSFGRFSTLSFHETKNFICGEGGALIVNKSEDVDRARILYDKGTDRQAFFKGEVDKYTWRDTGSSFGLSDVLAAYLFGQLERRDEILTKRRRVFLRYLEALTDDARDLGIQLPTLPLDSEPGYHLFYALMPDAESRSRTVNRLNDLGIGATFHYVPLHESPGGQRFGEAPLPLPVTESVASRLIRLPFHNALSDQDVDYIASTFLKVAAT
jgi:dTDP-4-amino-4,6-dideoxygalactose transaminase